MYPRKLFVEMKAGRAVWRCACFKELGWSDVRKVTQLQLAYNFCFWDAIRCQLNIITDNQACSVAPRMLQGETECECTRALPVIINPSM
jgi:hypothetical protein